MDKQSTLYQLIGTRMNGIMNGITEQDEDYHALLRAVDEYSGRPEARHNQERKRWPMDSYNLSYTSCLNSRKGSPTLAGGAGNQRLGCAGASPACGYR